MNDTSTLLKDREELVKESLKFPIEFQSGNPGGVFDRLTVHPEDKKARIESLSKPLDDIGVLAAIAPDIGESMDRQIQRLLIDLKRSPSNIYILNNLGRTYLSMGKLNEAVECFKNILLIDGNHRLGMVHLAKAYIIQNKPAEALNIYREYVEKYPDDEKTLIDLAYTYLRIGRVDEARETIDKSLLLKPNNPNAHHTSAILYLIKGDVDKAIASFRRATSLDSHFTTAYNALGVCYAVKRNFPKAIKYLRIAFALEPQNGHIVNNLAQCYQDEGDSESAVILLTEYLKRRPRDWQAQNKLAFSYIKFGDYRRSLDCLQSILKSFAEGSTIGDKYAEILNNMGVVYLHMGKNQNAENMFRQSLEASKKPNPIFYFNLTRMLTDLGRRDEAKKLIDEYIKIAPGDQTPLILLSQNYIYEGEYEKAREVLRNILDKNPDSRDASILWSSLNSEVFDDCDKALDTLKRVLIMNKSDQVVLNDLAYCYLKKGLLDAANDVLGSVNWEKAIYPLYATKGLLQILRGKLTEGINLYDSAVGKAPNYECKNLVRQKKNIEVARYFLNAGKRDQALRYLNNALSIKTRAKLYIDQAGRMKEQIERLPEQGRLPLSTPQSQDEQQQVG